MAAVSIVAPRAGAWVETDMASLTTSAIESHPVRVRGLKHCLTSSLRDGLMSHPVRVRGLKLDSFLHCDQEIRRTPCGCVG